MRDLKDRIALVTGGSSGIGRSICRALAGEGCQVVNISRRREPKEGGVPVDALPNITTELCDIRYTKLLRKIISKYDIDILINNAGILTLDDFLFQTEKDYYNVMDTNFKAPIFAIQAALPTMLSKDWGAIINIASTSGLKADPDTPIYGASKAALINFTESIAAQYGTIQCNCICPGFIDTLLVQEGPGIPQGEIIKVPMRRVGKPEEVSEVVIWVLKSTYMTGATITVDGGRTHGVWCWEQ